MLLSDSYFITSSIPLQQNAADDTAVEGSFISPGPDCCKPSGDAGGELFFQSLPSFPGVTGPTHLREAKGRQPAVSRGERQSAFPSPVHREEGLLPEGFRCDTKLLRIIHCPVSLIFFFLFEMVKISCKLDKAVNETAIPKHAFQVCCSANDRESAPSAI